MPARSAARRSSRSRGVARAIQHVGLQLQCRDRRAQRMRGIGDEVALAAHGLALSLQQAIDLVHQRRDLLRLVPRGSGRWYRRRRAARPWRRPAGRVAGRGGRRGRAHRPAPAAARSPGRKRRARPPRPDRHERRLVARPRWSCRRCAPHRGDTVLRRPGRREILPAESPVSATGRTTCIRARHRCSRSPPRWPRRPTVRRKNACWPVWHRA